MEQLRFIMLFCHPDQLLNHEGRGCVHDNAQTAVSHWLQSSAPDTVNLFLIIENIYISGELQYVWYQTPEAPERSGETVLTPDSNTKQTQLTERTYAYWRAELHSVKFQCLLVHIASVSIKMVSILYTVQYAAGVCVFVLGSSARPCLFSRFVVQSLTVCMRELNVTSLIVGKNRLFWSSLTEQRETWWCVLCEPWPRSTVFI